MPRRTKTMPRRTRKHAQEDHVVVGGGSQVEGGASWNRRARPQRARDCVTSGVMHALLNASCGRLRPTQCCCLAR